VLEVQTAPLEHALSVAQPAKTEDRAALQKHLGKVYDQQQLVKAATEAVALAEKAEAVKSLKALQASATAEAKAPMTILGIRHLVQDRLEWQKVMDDKSNKNSGVWDKIAVSYNARVDSGVLPPSDRRSVDSLKAKWSTLDGACKQHCRAIQRRKDSSAARDDIDAVVNCAVGEHGKTVATDIFFKFGRQERPACDQRWCRRMRSTVARQTKVGPTMLSAPRAPLAWPAPLTASTWQPPPLRHALSWPVGPLHTLRRPRRAPQAPLSESAPWPVPPLLGIDVGARSRDTDAIQNAIPLPLRVPVLVEGV